MWYPRNSNEDFSEGQLCYDMYSESEQLYDDTTNDQQFSVDICYSEEQLCDDAAINDQQSDPYFYDLVFDSLHVKKQVDFLSYIETGPNGAVARMWNHLLHEETAVKVEPFSDSIIIKNWPQMRHPNILPLIDITSIHINKKDLEKPLEWTVYTMPLYQGSLLSHLYRKEFYNNPRSFFQAREWISQVACGMNYLHMQGLYHLDIKTDNVLMSDRGKAVLGDFTFLTRKTYVRLPCIGCPQPYQPPEATYSKNKMISEKVDIWAFAVLVLNIVTGHELCYYGESMDNCKNVWSIYIRPFIQRFNSTSQLHLYLRETFPSYEFTRGEVRLAKDFLKFLLKENPSQRPTACTILRHAFLTQLDDFEMVKTLSQCYLQIPEDTVDHLFLHWWESPTASLHEIFAFETKQSSICYCNRNKKIT